MKNILMVCLLGLGLLIPASHVSATELSTSKVLHKAADGGPGLDIWIEGDALLCGSDESSGELTKLKIADRNKVVVFDAHLSGYYTSTDISNLPSGMYYVKVFTEYTSLTEVVFVE